MDDFQRAAAAAQRRFTPRAWTALPPREQSQAIYAELRRIDAERMAAAFAAPKRGQHHGEARRPDAPGRQPQSGPPAD